MRRKLEPQLIVLQDTASSACIQNRLLTALTAVFYFLFPFFVLPIAKKKSVPTYHALLKRAFTW